MPSKVDYVDENWNVTAGCTKISAGCQHCYAERIALSLQRQGVRSYRDGFKPRMAPEVLEKPFTWLAPKRIFVSNMGDLFHDDIPDDYINRVFFSMEHTPQHTFLVLTKRSDRMKQLLRGQNIPKHIHVGVTVESSDYYWRLQDLCFADLHIPTRWVSVEPMLGPVSLTPYMLDFPNRINWVVAGCESGTGARPMNLDWIRSLRDECVSAHVPFYFKQMPHQSVAGKTIHMPRLDGKVWDQLPES